MAEKTNIENIRRDYTLEELSKGTVSTNPFEQFTLWLEEAIAAKEPEPTAMTLSTVNTNHQPSSRIVLLKGISNDRLVFFTNFESRKGQELSENPNAAINFFWPFLERQVRIEGVISKISVQESEEYFQKRPRGSQIGAWASPQSKEINNRKDLEDLNKKFEDEFEAAERIPRPDHWGGYGLIPTYFEFWQGRSNRLHDRIVYQKTDNNWTIKRLAP